MEQKIVQRLCPGQPVRLIGCNGDSVSMFAVYKALNLHIRMLKNYHPIVILLDRERRMQTCDVLIAELRALLDQNGHTGRYVIGMADRTIENWILADWSSACTRYEGCREFGDDSEACHGKSTIRRLMPRNIIYHETTIGVELFLLVRPATIFEASKSFRDFVGQLKIGCYWLRDLPGGCLPA